MLKGLPNLKQYDIYKGISVFEDFTQTKREIIKQWCEKANKKKKKKKATQLFGESEARQKTASFSRS